MNVPEDLRYTREHEWVKMSEGRARVGITDHAQHELGDITYVELPTVGTTVAQGKELVAIESVKAASDVYAPVGGSIVAVNDALEDAPETVNQDPYGDGWLCELSECSTDEYEALMDAAAYTAYCAE